MTSEAPNNQPNRIYVCPGCGGNQVYDARGSCLSCPYCGREEQIPQTEREIKEYSYEEYLKPRPEALKKLAPDAMSAHCASCGATVTFTATEFADACPFCGTSIVTQPQVADPTVAPEAVLPFRLTQQQASAGVRSWIGSRWFAPSALKRLSSQSSISGVYLPYWVYASGTTSYYTGERGEHYYETESYEETDQDGNTVSRTRQVQRTAWYAAAGTVIDWFENVLICGTNSLHENHQKRLGPWDLSRLRPFDPAYLSGFKAQIYQVDVAQGFEGAKEEMAGQISEDVRRDIGGDEQRIFNISTAYYAITFKYILLPIYLAAYWFNQKTYQVLVNADTGEVRGDRPYSAVKIALLVVVILAVLALLYLYFSHKH